MNQLPEKIDAPSVNRIAVVRDAVVFQVKLALDGIVDLLLLPVSMVGAIVSFFTGAPTFYEIVRAGRAFDRRINLFGAADDAGGDPDQIEKLARRVEAEILREYEAGRIQASTRAALDRVLGALRKSGGSAG